MRTIKINKQPQFSELISDNLSDYLIHYKNNTKPTPSSLIQFSKIFVISESSVLIENSEALSNFIQAFQPKFPQETLTLAQHLPQNLCYVVFQNIIISDPSQFVNFIVNLNPEQFIFISTSIQFFYPVYNQLIQHFSQFQECEESICEILNTNGISIENLLELPFFANECYFKAVNKLVENENQDQEKIGYLLDKIDVSSVVEFRSSVQAFQLFLYVVMYSQINRRSCENNNSLKMVKYFLKSVDLKKQVMGYQGLLELSRISEYYAIKIGVDNILQNDIGQEIAIIIGGEFLDKYLAQKDNSQ